MSLQEILSFAWLASLVISREKKNPFSVIGQPLVWVWPMPQEMPPAAYILCFQASFKTSVSSVLLKAFLFLCLVLSCSGVTDFSNIICFFATRIVSSPFSRHLCLRQQQAAAFGASSLSSAQLSSDKHSWGVSESEVVGQDLVLSGFFSICPVLHPQTTPLVSRQWRSRGKSKAILPPWHKTLPGPVQSIQYSHIKWWTSTIHHWQILWTFKQV